MRDTGETGENEKLRNKIFSPRYSIKILEERESCKEIKLGKN